VKETDMNTAEIQTVLKKHRQWLRSDHKGARADLSGANLSGADLSGANLSGANLSGADLSGADLSGANLSGADLSGANLSGADLSGANLYRADLSGADLYRADLSGADLSGADLSGADLSGANLNQACVTDPSGDTVQLIEHPIQLSTKEYHIIIFDKHMQIGCEPHTFTSWWDFDESRIIHMEGGKALKFWRQWKKPLQQIIGNMRRNN
jgi:hypothetical protein